MKALLWLGFGAVLACASPSASAYTLLGAETLPVRDTAIDIQVGYPEVRFGYHIPVLANLEIVPRLHMFYSGGTAMAGSTLSAGNFGLFVGADFKFNFFNSGKLHLAAIWKFGVPLNFTPDFRAGLHLGLPGGIVMDYEITDAVRLIGGLHFQSAVFFEGDGIYNLPMIFEIGADFALTANFRMGVTFEGGPSFFFPSAGSSSTTGYLGGFLSLQILL